jgi:hypothetical protein
MDHMDCGSPAAAFTRPALLAVEEPQRRSSQRTPPLRQLSCLAHPETSSGSHGLRQPAAAFSRPALLAVEEPQRRSSQSPPNLRQPSCFAHPETPSAAGLPFLKRQQAAAVHVQKVIPKNPAPAPAFMPRSPKDPIGSRLPQSMCQIQACPEAYSFLIRMLRNKTRSL